LGFFRFARRALDRLLNDWEAVKSMLLTGYKSGTSSSAPLYEDRAFLVSGYFMFLRTLNLQEISEYEDFFHLIAASTVTI
jgi:hypothetical protein